MTLTINTDKLRGSLDGGDSKVFDKRTGFEVRR